MATRFYFSTNAADVTPSSWNGGWSGSSDSDIVGPYAAGTTKSNTALTTGGNITGNGTNPNTQAAGRWVSPPLSGQTISSGTTITGYMRCVEGSTATANATLALFIGLINADGSAGDTVLALAAADATTTPPEMGTALASRQWLNSSEASPTTSGDVSVTSGQRLVIEIGGRLATTSTARYFNIRFGDPSATSDFSSDNDTTNDYCPWVEFSQTLSFAVTPSGTDSATIADAGSVSLPLVPQVADLAAVSDSGSVVVTPEIVSGSDLVAVSDTGTVAVASLGVLFDAASNGAHDAAANQLTWSHTCSGTDRLLVVGVTASNPDYKFQSVTYNGVNLTRAPQRAGNWGVTNTELWYLVGPASGSAYNVVATHETTVGDIIGVSASYTNVDQTYPLAACVHASGANGAASVTATSATGQRVVDSLGGLNVNGDPVAGSGQTKRASNAEASTYWTALSDEAGDASVTMSWTTSFLYWGQVAASFFPAGEGFPCVSRSDEVAIADSATVTLSAVELVPDADLVGASDSATVVLDPLLVAPPADLVGVSDSGQVALGLVSVSGIDSAAVSDAYALSGTHFLSRADTVAAADGYAATLWWYGGAIAISDSGQVSLGITVSVGDTAAVSDAGQVALGLVSASGADLSAVSDGGTVVVTPVRVSGTDLATASDTYSGKLHSYGKVAVSDSGTVIVNVGVTRSDGAAVSDSGTVALGLVSVSGTDLAAISDAATAVVTPVLLTGSDNAAASDSGTVGLTLVLQSVSGTETVAASDAYSGKIGWYGGAIAASDSGTVQLVAPDAVNLDLRTDLASIADAGTVLLTPLLVSGADVVAASDALAVAGTYWLARSDSATVSDSGIVVLGTVLVSGSDSAALSDAYAWSGTDSRLLSDSAAISDSGTVLLGTVTVTGSDSASASDSGSVRFDNYLTRSDSAAVSDAGAVRLTPILQSGTDLAAVSDGYSGERLFYSPAYITDYGQVQIITPNQLDLLTQTDRATVSDAAAVVLTPLLVSVSDAVAASDARSAEWPGTLDVSVSDRGAVSDAATVGFDVGKLVTDTAAISDSGTVLFGQVVATGTDRAAVSDSGTVSLVGGNTVTVGRGYFDGSMRQIVRTSTGVVYTITPWMDDYEYNPIELDDRIRIYKANNTAIPPSGFTEKDSGNEPQPVTTCAAALDGDDNIHIAWLKWSNTTTTKYLEYCVFNTSTDTYGSVTQIQTNLDFSGDAGQGDEGVAIAVDGTNKAHIVYLSTNGNGSLNQRRIYYTNNVSGSWASQTQVDSDVSYTNNYKAWHPGICFDTQGRIVASWLHGEFNGNNNGTIYVRVRETSGSWNSSVSVAASVHVGIDQCVSLMVTGDNRYHLAYSSDKNYGADNLWQYARYAYSDNAGGSWATNHPTNTYTHNVTVGPGAPGTVRLWMHGYGTTDLDVYYFEGTGGSGSWGSQQRFSYIGSGYESTAGSECTVNLRWSQHWFYYPSTIDVGWWDAVYDNNLGQILILGSQKFGADVWGRDTAAVSDSATVVLSVVTVSLSDPAAVSDAASVLLTPLLVQGEDLVGVSDSGTVQLGQVALTRTDTAAVSDASALGFDWWLTRTDTAAISDSATVVCTPLLVAGADTVAVSDERTTQLLTVGALTLDTRTDLASISDAATVLCTPLIVVGTDTVAASVAVTATWPGRVDVGGSDVVAASDATTATWPGLVALTREDWAAVSDALTVTFPGTLDLVVADTVAASDARSVEWPGSVDLVVADTVAASDTRQTVITPLVLTVSDTVAVSDERTTQTQEVAALNVSGTDLVAVSDAAWRDKDQSVSDAASVSDFGRVDCRFVLAYDTSNEVSRTATTDPYTAFTGYTPGAGTRGILVAAINYTTATDQISSITYGGVTLQKIVGATDSAGEPTNTSFWFLGQGVPTGAQNVVVDFSSATDDDYYFVVISVRANADLEVIDSDQISISTTQADPQLTLQYNGREALAFCAIASGLGSPTSLTLLSGMSAVQDNTAGVECQRVDRQTTAGTSDFTIGYTAVADDVSFVALALAEMACLRGTDTVAASDWAEIPPPGEIGVQTSDTVGVSDAYTAQWPGSWEVARADTSAVSDAVTATFPGSWEVSRTDSAAFSDAATLDYDWWHQTSDTAAISDAATVVLDPLYVTATDWVAASDSGAASSALNLTRSDTAAVSDAVTAAWPGSFDTTRTDTVAISDSGTARFGQQVASVTVTAAVSDTGRILLEPEFVTGTDVIGGQDAAAVIVNAGEVVGDGAALSDAVTILLDPLLLVVTDTVAASDSYFYSSIAFYGVDFSNEAMSGTGVTSEALSGTGVTGEALSTTGMINEALRPT